MRHFIIASDDGNIVVGKRALRFQSGFLVLESVYCTCVFNCLLKIGKEGRWLSKLHSEYCSVVLAEFL